MCLLASDLLAFMSDTVGTVDTLKVCFKRFAPPLLPIFAASLLITFQAPTVCVLALNAQDDIAAFEQRLFFRNYAEDDISVRLNRIEKQVFGENFAGSVEERINRITSALPEKESATK